MSKTPSNLKYTRDHEWIKVDGDIALIGITDYAQSELGDIVYVEVDSIDEALDAGDTFGTVEAVKTTSDLYMPVSGTVLEFNQNLEDSPETINNDPYGEGWIIKVKMSNAEEELGHLLSAGDYQEEIG